MAVVSISSAEISTRGIVLALLSGAVTSGLGYVIWYAALEYLSAMQAALVQLSVPAIALAGGAWLLAEPLTARLNAALESDRFSSVTAMARARYLGSILARSGQSS